MIGTMASDYIPRMREQRKGTETTKLAVNTEYQRAQHSRGLDLLFIAFTEKPRSASVVYEST